MRKQSFEKNRHRWRADHGSELIVVAAVITILLAGGLVMAATSRRSEDTPMQAGGLAITATAIGSPGGDIPTEITDPGLATYVAQLTATPVYVAPKPTGTPDLPTPEPEPTLAAGIDNENLIGPFSPQEFRTINMWKGPTSTGWMMVFAGAIKDPGPSSDERPGLRVYTIATDGANRVIPGGISLLGDFDAPLTAESLEIVAVESDVLHLETAAGELISFDVTTLEYIP